MPRGVLLGEPEILGVAPYERRSGELCFVLLRRPDTRDVVPAACRWGLPIPGTPRRRRLQIHLGALESRRWGRAGRCLVPVGGYVQPTRRNLRIGVVTAPGVSLSIAGVWLDVPGGPCFAVVTTEPNDLLAPAHARMPVLLPETMWSVWLADRPLTRADLALVERPAPPAWLRARALKGGAGSLTSLSVAKQVEEWAPGSTLWRDELLRQQEEREIADALG